MYRIYDIDSLGVEYCITGLIQSYAYAKTMLLLLCKEHANAYIKASNE